MLLGEEGIKLPNSLIEHSKRDTVIAGSHSLFYINVKFIHNRIFRHALVKVRINCLVLSSLKMSFILFKGNQHRHRLYDSSFSGEQRPFFLRHPRSPFQHATRFIRIPSFIVIRAGIANERIAKQCSQ